MQDFSVLSPPKPAPDTQILPAAVWGPSGQGRLAHEGGSRAVLVSHTGCRAGGRLARSLPSRASGSQLGVPLERRLPAPTACRPGVLTLLRGPWERPAGQTAPRVSPRCPRVLRGPPCPTLRVSGLGLPHGSPRRPLQWDLPAPDATASLRQQEKVCGAELPHVSHSRVRAAPFPGHLLRGLPALPSFRPGRGPVPLPVVPTWACCVFVQHVPPGFRPSWSPPCLRCWARRGAWLGALPRTWGPPLGTRSHGASGSEAPAGASAGRLQPRRRNSRRAHLPSSQNFRGEGWGSRMRFGVLLENWGLSKSLLRIRSRMHPQKCVCFS